MQNLTLASVLASTDALFVPIRNAARQKAADRARGLYGRFGLLWPRPNVAGSLSACKELQRRGMLVRSSKRAMLTDRGQAHARAVIGLPGLADSWPILHRLRDDEYTPETALIDGLANWEAIYRLEHHLLPALTVGFVWSKPDGTGGVGYRLSGAGDQDIRDEPPAPLSLSVDREASQFYQTRFLALAG